MHNAVANWSKMEEGLAGSNRQLNKFNTASVVFDSDTGNYYYGMNRGIQLSGDNLNSSLKSWFPEQSLNQYRLGIIHICLWEELLRFSHINCQ